jgi:methyltransferase (TIGR00027 family)
MRAGAPSRTAEYMALFRALESLRPPDRRLVEDRAAVRFLDPRLRGVVHAARLSPLRSLITAFIDRRWPGPRLSGVVRTRVIDDLVRDAIRGGCTQLVLLGAGYDTRATRLPEAASTLVFEIDHPSTQARKREALGMTPAHVRYVPLDFERDSLAHSLTDAGLDPGRQSCVVWEGVFSYLSAEAIDLTLAALVETCAPGNLIILTYVDQRVLDESNPRPQPWVAAVRSVAEPFRTGLRPEHAASFFAARNLRLCCDETTTEAATRLCVTQPERIPSFYHLATLEVKQEHPLKHAVSEE